MPTASAANDLIEAREICASIASPQHRGGTPDDYRAGHLDQAITTRLALLGIKRGRELEKEKAK